MITRFEIISPIPALKDFIQRIFVIESQGKFPNEDLKLIVPNGCAKLIIPFRNSIRGKTSVWDHLTPENKIGFIGIGDNPAIVDYRDDAPAGTITFEFSPGGAYRFFTMNYRNIKNNIYDYEELAGNVAKDLEEQLVNITPATDKVKVVQQFLLQQLTKTENDPVLDYCVQQIMVSNGRISITELEKYTGYSARWLNMKFHEKIGLSPKNLSSIIRFQQYYKSLVTSTEQFFLEKEFYNYYHDQSHFIKDFKRFTGHSPSLLARADNNYDKFFYKG